MFEPLIRDSTTPPPMEQQPLRLGNVREIVSIWIAIGQAAATSLPVNIEPAVRRSVVSAGVGAGGRAVAGWGPGTLWVACPGVAASPVPATCPSPTGAGPTATGTSLCRPCRRWRLSARPPALLDGGRHRGPSHSTTRPPAPTIGSRALTCLRTYRRRPFFSKSVPLSLARRAACLVTPPKTDTILRTLPAYGTIITLHGAWRLTLSAIDPRSCSSMPAWPVRPSTMRSNPPSWARMMMVEDGSPCRSSTVKSRS